tara:strand:- start:70 stop:261 length:192 start_codon:yes stop_codon:yes gene_type:complete
MSVADTEIANAAFHAVDGLDRSARDATCSVTDPGEFLPVITPGLVAGSMTVLSMSAIVTVAIT